MEESRAKLKKTATESFQRSAAGRGRRCRDDFEGDSRGTGGVRVAN